MCINFREINKKNILQIQKQSVTSASRECLWMLSPLWTAGASCWRTPRLLVSARVRRANLPQPAIERQGWSQTPNLSHQAFFNMQTKHEEGSQRRWKTRWSVHNTFEFHRRKWELLIRRQMSGIFSCHNNLNLDKQNYKQLLHNFTDLHFLILDLPDYQFTSKILIWYETIQKSCFSPHGFDAPHLLDYSIVLNTCCPLDID